MQPANLNALALQWSEETPNTELEAVWRACPEDQVLEVANLVNRVNAAWDGMADLYTIIYTYCDRRAEAFLAPYVYAGMLLILKEEV